MKKHFGCLAGVFFCGMVFLSIVPVRAETVFVSGVSDGFRTYAVIRRNGVEYRTDQVGATFNRNLWRDLSAEDSMKLIRTYGWQLNRRRGHFGTDISGEMAQFYNDEAGWTALVDALQDRRMNKDYPRLHAAFGPQAVLDIPLFGTGLPEVRDSATYRQAAILAAEVREDYEIGRKLYQTLTQVKWDQVSVAVKGISGPLIKIMVDNFMTPFVTHGAKPVSELAATMYGFAKDLKDFIEDRQRPGSKPPTPGELIARIEALLIETERLADRAADEVDRKLADLQGLAEIIEQMNQNISDERASKGQARYVELQTRAAQRPDPGTIHISSDGDTPHDIWLEMNQKCMDAYSRLMSDARDLENEMNESKTEFLPVYAAGMVYPGTPEAVNQYFGGMQTQFQDAYLEIRKYLIREPLGPFQTTMQPWTESGYYEPTRHQLSYRSQQLGGSIGAALAFLDEFLPQIDVLEARAGALDAYSDWMGSWDDENEVAIPAVWKTSERFHNRGMRNLEDVIQVVSTPTAMTQERINDYAVEQRILAPAEAAFASGRSQRIQWMRDEANRYDSLRFNFESSLSYVMAALNEFDALHADPTFYIWMTPESYLGPSGNRYSVHLYRVDIPYLQSLIDDQPTAEAKQIERLRILDQLHHFREQEETLERRLIIAQNAHLANATELDNWHSALLGRYDGSFWDYVVADFKEAIGKTLISQLDLYQNLIGENITYYYLGDANWIRTPERCRSDLTYAAQRISGMTATYYNILDLYERMEFDRATFLAMTEEQFVAFMTDTTQKIGSTPQGTWISQLQAEGVWGSEYPAWRLVWKTRTRQEGLNSEYRWETPPPDPYPGISGFITTDIGSPVEGATVRLSGQMNAWTTTEADGSYRFDFLPSGDFVVTPAYAGAGFVPASRTVTFSGEEVSAHFSLPGDAANGYALAGRVTDGEGQGVGGIRISVFTAAGEHIADRITHADGAFNVSGLDGASYAVKPVDDARVFQPASRTIVAPPSSATVNFDLLPEPATRILRLTGDLHFGEVVTGESATRILRLHNDGNTAIGVDGLLYSAGFQGAWRGQVPAGGTRDVPITFAPLMETDHTGEIAILSDATSGTVSMACSGTGIAPPPSVHIGGILDFGMVTTNMTATRSLVIRNRGTRYVVVDGIATPPGFSGAWSGVVAARDVVVTPLTFTPLDVAPYSGQISVSLDATTTVAVARCSGQGVTLRIPAAWLESWGLPADGSVDFDDLDGDGFTVWQEWRAGTNPTNSASALRALSPIPPAADAAGFRIRWQGVADRSYRIKRSSDLTANPPFITIVSNLQGFDGTMEYLDETATTDGPWFYRIVLE